MTGGQAVVRALEAGGIDTVFGIVGTHNVGIFDALYDAPNLRVVTTRHEQGAGFMADGYARATGRIAAVVTVPGPGLTNLMTALGQASLDSVPLVAITGQNPLGRLDRRLEEFHELRDSLQVARSVTACAVRLENAADAADAIDAALRQVRGGRPQPVLVEVPMDVASTSSEAEVPSRLGEAQRPAGDPEAIQRAADVLATARRPLILAGGGVISSGGETALRHLAERLGAPVITTIHGKGAIPEDHPLSVGDGWGRLDYYQPLFAEADACLAVGANFDYISDPSRGADLPAPLVHVDVERAVLGRHRAPDVAVCGDARAVLASLAEALGSDAPRQPWSDLGAVRARKRTAVEAAAGPVLGLLEAIRAVLPRDGIVVDDLCLPGYWAPAALEIYEPRTFLHPGMFGTLGYALPAAIGAKIGLSDRQVVALIGDGGFLYTGQELATAVQEQVDLVAIVFNDNAYGALKLFQDRALRRRRIGVELRNPDFAALAEAYGARGIHLARSADLRTGLEEALGTNGPVVVECPLDFPNAASIPPWMA